MRAWTYLRGEAYVAPAVVRALLKLPGVADVLPAYDSTLVEHDAMALSPETVERAADAAGERAGAEAGRSVEVPVAYGGEHGPDLEAVATRAGLDPQEAARRHAGAEYVVRAMGFSPGFPFLSGLPRELETPRLAAPRARVPAHSVGVAGRQSGVYPVPSPGGWNLIGRALVPVYDPHREDPFLLAVGDRVRFVPVDGRGGARRRGGRDARGAAAVPPDPEPLDLLPRDPTRPAFEVLEPGLLDLVVDAGRLRAGRFGLARSGPLDAPAAGLANRLMGNDAAAPALELTLTGPRLLVLARCVVAVTGPALTPLVNGEPRSTHEGIALKPADEVAFVPTGRGARSYLAVAGGLDAAAFLGSASVDSRGLIGRPLRAGDVLGRADAGAAVAGRRFVPHEPSLARGAGPFGRVAAVRLLPGPQREDGAWAALLAGEFEVGASDRVGVRLMGTPVPGGEVTSEGVPIGAVQVPPGGQPIVLLADRGTLGGYAKPAVVHPADLRVLAQLRAGDRLRFRA